MQMVKFRKKKNRLLKKGLLYISLFFFLYFVSFFIKLPTGFWHFLNSFYYQSNVYSKSDVTVMPILKNIDIENKPIIYIYNTHQKEEYEHGRNSAININYNVMHSALLLEDYLNDLNIEAYVEKEDVTSYLNTLGYKYYQSYLVSRSLLEKRKKEMPSLNYFIDIHRDAVSYDLSVCDFDNKKYAKVLFVIGLKNAGYEQNLSLAQRLNDILLEINPCISRGIMKKEGPYVDGVYNQDFSPNTLLIEVGSNENYFEEVNNTLKVLASALERVISG